MVLGVERFVDPFDLPERGKEESVMNPDKTTYPVVIIEHDGRFLGFFQCCFCGRCERGKVILPSEIQTLDIDPLEKLKRAEFIAIETGGEAFAAALITGDILICCSKCGEVGIIHTSQNHLSGKDHGFHSHIMNSWQVGDHVCVTMDMIARAVQQLPTGVLFEPQEIVRCFLCGKGSDECDLSTSPCIGGSLSKMISRE